ncbi:MAG: RNB domain-containing ribonuclease, partial [Bacteroidetes bacterium]|nr:RNB domain-containing ribonuclease [Bacteroidota bacterium]
MYKTPQRIGLLMAIAAVALTATIRIIPHIPNFAPIGALALFSGAIIKNKRIGIHIADVAEILKEYKHDRYSTVYATHKNVHMIPDEIATEMASLREGKVKGVITCWINEDGEYTFETNNVIIKKNI